ncbi:MAG: hypothetical protein HUU15_12510 [Candidatus Brocadiae bacterium]|nr:hypothetical protein [Candidatus Brocadiia bacterium]
MTVRSARIPDSGTCATRHVARPQVLLVAPPGPERGRLANLVGLLGAVCFAAEGEEDALSAFEHGMRFALVCADTDLRPGGGPEFARRMATVVPEPRPPVILFGNSGDPRGSAAALDGTVAAWVDRRQIYLQWTSRLLSGFLD